jgi:23S rRNA (adenine2503-C2)-methyltransferase
VNLIPFNPWPGSPSETSSQKAIDRFAKIVNDAGFSSPVRTPRGRDILAACGQLRTASRRKARGFAPGPHQGSALDPPGD